MYLKALEIQGFKSFPEKTVLTFDEDVTAIVGPNGSGKSNIADAILWVMGEQSTRNLRGGKMEDVIFSGTEKRRQMGYAEVSLILDNSGGLFDRPEAEVMVTRRCYRSGESEYYINKSACRLRDVNELFMDTGMGREGYSIIGQGKADAILSVKSADRREIFEEAAGISHYRHRKEEAERKLSRTAENLLRISDKIDELKLQLEPLREQAERAKQYLALRDELRGWEVSAWMEQLDRLREDNRKWISDCEAAAAQRDEASKAQEALYRRSEELAEEMRKLELRLEETHGQSSAREASAAELESQIAVLQTEVRNRRENADRLRSEMTEQGDREQSVATQIEDRQRRLEEIRTRREELQVKAAEQEAQAEQLRHSAGDLAEVLEDLHRREQMQNASAGEARSLLSALAAAGQEILDRDTVLSASIRENQDRLDTAQKEAEAKRRQRDAAAEERNSAANVIRGYELRLESRRKKLDEAADRAAKLTMEENTLSSRIQMLTEMEKLYEGYSGAVKAVMQAARAGRLSGIRGPVAGLLKTPDRCTVAIEIALGGAMQNLVVEREEDGKAAIAYLKQRDAGRATFLPMDAVRGDPIREKDLDRQSGFVGIAADLVEFDPQYEAIFSRLLGRVIVAEDMDSALAIARQFHHRYRVVTLDGQVLNVGGSMTGGSVSRSAGILSRANELERLSSRIDGVRDQLSRANAAGDSAKREADAAAYDYETAQDQKRELDAAVLKLEGEVGQYDVLLDGLQRGIASAREEQAALAERLHQNEADTDAARSRIAELEGESAALQAQTQAQAAGEAELREKQEAQAAAAAELNRRLAALDAEETSVNQTVTELTQLHRDLSLDRDRRLELLETSSRQEEELSGRVCTLEEQLSACRTEKEKLAEELRLISQERLQLEAQRTQADREARGKNEELLRLERECARLEQKKSAGETEEKQILDKLWDTYELSHSEAERQRREISDLRQANRRIAQLRRSVGALGAVNVGAIEEFQRVNERYTYLTDQRDDVEKSKSELEGIIRSVTGEMEKIFAEQFQTISRSFTQTFRELFGGGTASLELEDKDDILNCGIEIKAQPPGKSLTLISLLSGGEKAFVAIALYFAILKVRPTPFVVLDEIEAALDDNNVVRFARYLRGMTDRTQFIVITHRRGTMEEADVLYGVTMQEQGISKILSINLNEAERELQLQ